MTGSSEDLAARWRDLFQEADSLDPEAPAEEKRRRGRVFEKILLGMLSEDRLEPRIRFRPTGEEIDGSFFHRGRVFLLEAKWTKDPQSASSIYQFRGKVEGKLIGTIGVFISMSGYSEDAVEALIAGKVLNVILFGDDDMRAIASRQITFAAALDQKLRDGAESGTPFSPLRDPVSGQPLYRGHDLSRKRQARPVIVEGQFDAILVHALAGVLGAPPYPLEVVPAGGLSNLAALASAANSAGFAYPVTIIADGDGHPGATRQKIESDLASRSPDLAQQTSIVVLDPTFEDALEIADGSPAGRRHIARDPRLLDEKLRAADVRQIASRNPEVYELLRELGLD